MRMRLSAATNTGMLQPVVTQQAIVSPRRNARSSSFNGWPAISIAWASMSRQMPAVMSPGTHCASYR
ncbi:hypothetical protein ASC87_08820 [Rhizobacter sp. Root1221]|nr:hypothetical protein ASC87_08820 [Rhizobacter sp. Root1221]